MFKTTRDVFLVLLIMPILLKHCCMYFQWNFFHFPWNWFCKNSDIYCIAHLNTSSSIQLLLQPCLLLSVLLVLCGLQVLKQSFSPFCAEIRFDTGANYFLLLISHIQKKHNFSMMLVLVGRFSGISSVSSSIFALLFWDGFS